MTAWIQNLRYYKFRSPSRFTIRRRICLSPLTFRLDRAFHSRLFLSFRVPTVLFHCSTGISTCCPSTTSFDLALGPDLPRADQLYSGTLGYSAERILTFLSLLIPAFSLPVTPRLLPVPLRRDGNAPLPITYVIPQLRYRVLAPYIFGAGPLDQ